MLGDMTVCVILVVLASYPLSLICFFFFKKNVCWKSVSTAANRPANELIEEKMR